MASNRKRTGPAWAALRAEIFHRDTAGYTHQPSCPFCGKPVDWRIPYRHPLTGNVDPRSPSINHKIRLDDGGALLDPANAELVHLGCNSKDGQEATSAKLRQRRQRPNSSRGHGPSRVW